MDEIANSAEVGWSHKSRPENCPVVVSDPSIFGSRPPWRPLPRVVIHECGKNFHDSFSEKATKIFAIFLMVLMFT